MERAWIHTTSTPSQKRKLEETLNQVIESQKRCKQVWVGDPEKGKPPMASTWPPQLEHSNKKCPRQKKINTVQINTVPSSEKLHWAIGYYPSQNIECQPLSQGELKELLGPRERGEEGQNLLTHLKKLAFFCASEWYVKKQYIHNCQFTRICLIVHFKPI